MTTTTTPARDRCPDIAAAINAAKMAHPYYWHSIDRLTFVPDPAVATMATSARWVTHYNPKTLGEWTTAEAGAVVVHELEHLLRDHAGREEGRDHGRWNVAADAEINQRLAGLPSGCVTPESIGMPNGRPAEVYYGATTPPKTEDPEPEEGEGEEGEGEGEGSGSGSGQPGEGEGSGSGSGSEEAEGEGSGSGTPGTGSGHGADCGSAAGGDVRPWEEGEEAAGQGVDPKTADRLREETAREVMANGPARGTGAGDDLREWAEGILHIDRNGWYRALATALGHTLASSGTPTRWAWPGRRDPRDVGGAVLPRWASDRPAAAVIIDTSGSITEDDIAMARGAGTLLARIADVEFYGCDDRAIRYGKTLPDRIRGGGGTDLRRGIAMAAADGARAIVLITDCGTPWPTEDEMAAYGVPMIVGANASAPYYPEPRTGQGYYEPPTILTTIIHIVAREG